MNDGIIFKKLRSSRNISQKDICKKCLSRTTLSKFENSKCQISYTNYQYLIDCLDMSSEEFNYIKNNYSLDQKSMIIKKFESIFSSEHNQKNIESLIKLIEKYLENHYSKSIMFIAKILYSFKHLDTSNTISCLSKIYISDIWDSMSDFDQLTLLDIKIINCSLYYFDYYTSLEIANFLLSSLRKYEKFTDISPLELSIYLNLTILSLINNNTDNAKLYSKYALNNAKNSKRLDYIIISLTRYGISHGDEESISRAKSLLPILNDVFLEKSLDNEILQFYKK